MFKAFTDLVGKIRGTEHDLQQEKESLIAKRHELNEQYAKMVADDSLGIKTVTAKELGAIRMEIQQVTEELDAVNDKIQAVESVKLEKLKEQFPAVRNEYRKEMAKKEAEFQAKIADMRRMKAEYLLFMRDFGKLRGEMREIYDQFMSKARLVTDEYEKMRPPAPTVNLFDNYAGEETMNAPSEREIYLAFTTGQVPKWILQYENGEVK